MSHFKCKKGFSLVELMVVIAIIAVMAGAVSVGFRAFLGTVGVENTVGHINDVFHDLDLETAIEEHQKSSVSFESDYLLVDSSMDTAGLALSVGSGCAAGEIKLISGNEALLYTRGATGKSFGSPIRVAAADEDCFNPLKYKEREVIYQLEKDLDHSNKIRIFPLNLDEDVSNDVYIENNNYRLDILAPYSKKKRYNNNVLLGEGIAATLTVKSIDEQTDKELNLPEN